MSRLAMRGALNDDSDMAYLIRDFTDANMAQAVRVGSGQLAINALVWGSG